MMSVRLFLAKIVCVLVVTGGVLTGAPLTTQLATTDLATALSEFESVAFNATARWQSNAAANFKMRISDGTSGSPNHLVTGGTGITWLTDGPQPFTVNFNGSQVVFSIIDGATTHTISATPALTAVNSILIALRSQTVPGTLIEVSNLTLNGKELTTNSASLGAVDERRFILVEGTGPTFTLTGNLRINKTGGSQEIPSMIIFAGMTDYIEPTTGGSLNESAVPEPGIFWMVALGLVMAFAGQGRQWALARRVARR